MVTKVIVKPEVLATASKGANVEEMLDMAKGRRLLSNAEVDKLLASNKWEKINEAFPCWTGTFAAYEKPGKALGKTVEYEHKGLTWVFPVPEKFHGEKDAALSVNHPHFTIKAEGDRRIIMVDDEANVKLTKDFPAKNGWHKIDENGIPCSDKLNEDYPHARYLHRTADPMAGPVARGFDDFNSRRGAGLSFVPSIRLGVVAEGISGEAGAPEKLAMEREAGRLVITGSDAQLETVAKKIREMALE